MWLFLFFNILTHQCDTLPCLDTWKLQLGDVLGCVIGPVALSSGNLCESSLLALKTGGTLYGN